MTERGLAGEESGVGALALGGVGVDPLVDLFRIVAVVGDSGLHQAQRDLYVVCGSRRITVVVTDYADDLPDVQARSHEACPPPRGTVDESHKRVVIHAQSLFDVSLCQRARRHTTSARPSAEPLDGAVR
jgi:hypothetical protein